MEELKTIAIRSSVHEKLTSCAKERGMILRGLTERIISGWLDENFFARNVATSNKRRASK